MTASTGPSPIVLRLPDMERHAWSLAAAVSAVLLLWFGAMGFLPFSADALAQRGGLSAESARVWARSLGVVQIGLGLGLLPLWPVRVRSTIALGVAVFWWLQMLALASPAMWVSDVPYDGFPFLGAGQGLLKHLGLGALGMGLWAHWRGSIAGQRWALRGLWTGQLLVLVWIGLLKFTAYEAQGVEGLMRGSPLFAWLYQWFSVQGASNVIGVVELATAGLIGLWALRTRWAVPGLVLAIGTYVLTSTFLFSTPGWAPGLGFPFVAGTGQFLLKDLGLLAGAVVLMAKALKSLSRP